MKKRLIVIVLILSLINIYAQSSKLIPRRVFFGFAGNSNVALVENPLVLELPDYLYTVAASLKPIVRAKNRDNADSSVIVAYSILDDFILLNLELFNKDKMIEKKTIKLNRKIPEMIKYTDFINSTAKDFAKYFNKIRQEVKVSETVTESNVKKLVQHVEYSEKLNKAYQLTLWASGITRYFHVPYSFDPGATIDRIVSYLPLSADFNWFFQKDFGAIFSVYYDYNDFIPFAFIKSGDEITGKSLSENYYFLPGIGLTYRILNFLSEEFNIIYYAGGVKITAVDPLSWNYYNKNGVEVTGLNLSPGETEWIFYSFISLQSVFSLNLAPWLSLKIKIATNLNPLIILNNWDINYYSLNYTFLSLNLFQLGLALRL